MRKNKISGVLIAIILCMVAVISVTIVAAGEEISSQPTGSVETTPPESGEATQPETGSTDPSDTTTDPLETTPTDPSETTPTEPTEPTEPEDKTMKVSDELLRVLKELEGFEPYAYWDYKQYSIGYGSKCPEGYETYYQKNPITLEYAEELLRKELVLFEEQINGFITRNKLTLNQHQYDALVSFTYNVGGNWTNGTTGNFNGAIIAGGTGSDVLYGMMLWSMAGNRHILIHRRIVEMNIYANGVYPEKPLDKANAPDRYRIAFMDANGGAVKYDEHGFDAEDPIAIKTVITSRPTGPDENGKTVTYVLDGWYTERVGGTKVEVLDANIPTGTVLYAHWKTPSGTPVVIPRQETGIKVTVKLTGDGVNVRSGPDTYYASLYKANTGDVLEIVEVVSRGGLLWGRFGDNWIALQYTDYSQVLADMLPKWAMVTGTTLNVRTGAGTDYAPVTGAQKKKGDLVKVTEWTSDGTMMWGKIEEGWIALPYVTFEGFISPDDKVTSIQVIQKPNKSTYVHKAETLDLAGSLLLVTYKGGQIVSVDLTADMVSGFDNTQVGTNTLTVTYSGKTTTFEVQIIKAKVVFQLEDGTVLSEKEYLFGDAVEIPEAPTAPEGYIFAGWDQKVAASCMGNATYTAKFQKKNQTGDLNGDAVYLLGYVLFPKDYPIQGNADMNGDGFVNDRDAVYLLGYVLFPEDYPLPK